MGAEIVGVVLLGVLFAAFGLLRPADRGGGCGACAHADESCAGGACPLLKDL